MFSRAARRAISWGAAQSRLVPVRATPIRPVRCLARAATARHFSATTASASSAGAGGGGFSFPGPTDLDAVVRLDLLRSLEPSEIARVWLEHHADTADDGATESGASAVDAADADDDAADADAAPLTDTNVACVLDAERYDKLARNVKTAPMFVLPVFRGGGFFNVLLQFQDNPPKILLFTSLDDFRSDPAGAQPYLAVNLFDDLKDDKGLVLLRGEITQQLTQPEARALLDATLRLYLGSDGRGLAGARHAGSADAADEDAFALVDRFNNEPATFDFDEALKVCQRLMGVKEVAVDEGAEGEEDNR